jgi:hypothetical protein
VGALEVGGQQERQEMIQYFLLSLLPAVGAVVDLMKQELAKMAVRAVAAV